MLANFVVARARAAASILSGALRAVLVNLETLTGDKSNEEPLFTGPIVFRPLPPVSHANATGLAPEGECEVVCLKEEDGLQPLALRDLRINARVQPADGEAMLAGYQGGYFSVRATTGNLGSRVAMYAPRLNGSGVETAAHSLVLDPHSSASPAIALTHAGGYSIRITNAGNTEVRNNLIVAPDSSPQPVVLWNDLATWISQVNAAFAAISAAAGNNPNPTITVPTASPISSTKLSAAP